MPRPLIFLFLAATSAANAWWAKGHEQVADIAWTRLTPEVKKELGEILKAGETDFRPASSSEADLRAAFRKAATWSDWMKDHKEGIFEEWINTWNAKFQPGYDPNDQDREAHRCKRWHYFDIPIRQKDGHPGVEGSNALIALTTARYELEGLNETEPKDRKQECWWVYWITHIVGDLHQPLHCVSSFEFEATGDAGGNLFKLGVGYPDNPKKMMNLHALWDSGIEAAVAAEEWSQPSPEAVSERWINAFAPGDDQLADRDLASWIEAGAKLSQEVVYKDLSRDGVPTKEYTDRLLDTCRKQAILAGFRLANELNALLKPRG